MYSFDSVISLLVRFGLALGILVLILLVVSVFGYMFIQWLKYHGREKYALDFVSLLIRLPRESETKIDAAEQMFASLHSMKHDGLFDWLKSEDLFAFEIVALKEEISFY